MRDEASAGRWDVRGVDPGLVQETEDEHWMGECGEGDQTAGFHMVRAGCGRTKSLSLDGARTPYPKACSALHVRS